MARGSSTITDNSATLPIVSVRISNPVTLWDVHTGLCIVPLLRPPSGAAGDGRAAFGVVLVFNSGGHPRERSRQNESATFHHQRRASQGPQVPERIAWDCDKVCNPSFQQSPGLTVYAHGLGCRGCRGQDRVAWTASDFAQESHLRHQPVEWCKPPASIRSSHKADASLTHPACIVQGIVKDPAPCLQQDLVWRGQVLPCFEGRDNVVTYTQGRRHRGPGAGEFVRHGRVKCLMSLCVNEKAGMLDLICAGGEGIPRAL